jgi:elongation factor P
MPPVSTNDLKNGMSLDLPEGLMQVVDFQHVKPGKGGAFVRTTLRNAGEKLEQAIIEKREMQFLYKAGDDYVFMDAGNYEQLEVPPSSLGDAVDYLKENDSAVVNFYKEEIVGIDLPASVELLITETEPGIQGDRVSGATKPATVETGKQIKVPLFVGIGDRVRVDTRTGDYITRV